MLSATKSEALLSAGKFSCHFQKLCSLQNQKSLDSGNSRRNFSSSKCLVFPNKFLNHYEVLGITRNATSEDIRHAFLELSKNYHPDKNSADPQNHNKFVEINEAYSVLSKPLLRREYDHSLLNRHHQNIPRQNSSAYGNPPSSTRFHERQSYGWAYDPQFYAYRDKSQDEYYTNHGVKGFSKMSDRKIVYLCMGIVLFGASFHFFVTKTMSDMHIEHLNARDTKIHKLWTNANNPNYISEQLERINDKIAKDEAKKREK